MTGPVVLKESQHGLRRDMICKEALRVLTQLDDAGYKGYLCGGGVRDLLLGIRPKDFDIATDAHPEQVKKVIRNSRIIGRRFKLVHVFFRDVIIETATFRALLEEAPAEAEGVPLPSRRNKDIPDPLFATRDGVIVRDNVYGTPEEDARRRDFTINGLFYDIADGSIIDYVGGLKDLERRVLRVIGDPAVRFHEDPVRMVRAVRIASQLDFEIERKAREQMVAMSGELQGASRERMYEESLKIMNCGFSEKIIDRAWRKNLFQTIYPSLSEWLQTDAGRAKGWPWVKKALRQFDVWKEAGLRPGPAVQHALFFGAYIEQITALMDESGVPPFEAAMQAVMDALRDKRNLTQIPKTVMYDVQRIMGLQMQMKKTSSSGSAGNRLKHRKGFDEALVYLKFASGLDPSRKDILARWI